MRGDDSRKADTRTSHSAFIRHFRNARRPMSVSPPQRPWLPAFLALLCAALVIVGSLGPWHYVERITGTGPETTMVYGARTDGIFSILFAVIAIIAMVFILLRPSAIPAVWIAFGAFVLCTAVGVFDWLLFAPAGGDMDAWEGTRVLEVEWGVKVVLLAGAAGATSSFIAARDIAGE